VSAPLAAGAVLAPGYTVIEHLNRGRELDVYDVWSDARDCRCVAKLLRPDLTERAAASARLEQEGALLARLTHPHLVRAYETLPGPIVILETLDGETLSYTIRVRKRRLPAAEIAWLGLHLCSAAHYLHGQNLLHLDLKPSNVIDQLGRARVIDLSLARPPGPVPAGVGTAQYLAPEQAAGGEAGPPADVWGIGATLFAAATGRRPFGVPAPGEPYEQLTRTAPPVGTLRRLPRALRDAIDGALAHSPADRPGVRELTARLEEGLPDEPRPLATANGQPASGSPLESFGGA
jgi:serine/threonine protein kinase